MFSGRIVSRILSLHAETNDDGLRRKGEAVAEPSSDKMASKGNRNSTNRMCHSNCLLLSHFYTALLFILLRMEPVTMDHTWVCPTVGNKMATRINGARMIYVGLVNTFHATCGISRLDALPLGEWEDKWKKRVHHLSLHYVNWHNFASWRPIGLWDVEALTFSRQSAHRWRWGYTFYNNLT
jgi:hypothetical protein